MRARKCGEGEHAKQRSLQQSSKLRSTRQNGPTNPWSKSSNPSLHQNPAIEATTHRRLADPHTTSLDATGPPVITEWTATMNAGV